MKNIVLVCCLMMAVNNIWSQEIKNVQASSTDDYMIIAYDLKGDANEMYDVKIHFLKSDSTKIIPRTLNGDVGKVPAGSGKTIVWNVYKDVDGIEGTLTPIIKVKTLPKDAVVDTPSKPMPIPGMPSKIMDVLTDQIGGGGRNKERVKFRKGVRIGFGKSGVKTDERRFFFANERSFMVGPYVRWNATKRFYLQPEVLFLQHNYSELMSSEELVSHQHNYVRGQLMAGVSAIPGLHLNAGMYYGYLIGGNEYDDLSIVSETINSDNIAPAGVTEFPIKEDDYGYLLGASISVGQGAFVMGWVHSSSLDNIITGDYHLGPELITGQDLRNRTNHFFIQKSF